MACVVGCKASDCDTRGAGYRMLLDSRPSLSIWNPSVRPSLIGIRLGQLVSRGDTAGINLPDADRWTQRFGVDCF